MAKDQQTQKRPSSRTVTIKNGRKITVGELSWAGYKAIKRALSDYISDELAGVFVSVQERVQQGEDPEQANQQTIRSIIGIVATAMDELSPVLVNHCVEDQNGKPFDAAALKTRDVLALRDAAAEVNDLDEILDLEKKALSGLATRLLKMINETDLADLSALSTAGGSRSSPSSPAPTGGEFEVE